MASPLCRGGNQPKSRRRNVARNIKIARLRNLVAEHSDGSAFIFDCRTHEEIIEHFFHMVSCLQWLFHCGLASGKKARKQQRAFDLCACYRWAIMNSTQRAPPDAQ